MSDFWYDADSVLNIYEMLKRFDEAGIPPQAVALEFSRNVESYRTQTQLEPFNTFLEAFFDYPDLFLAPGYDTLDAIADKEEAFQRFLRESREEETLKESLEGRSYDPVMGQVNAEQTAHAQLEGATVPMKDYVSPASYFNTFFKNFPDVVEIADILVFFEKSGMRIDLLPFGKLKPKAGDQSLRDIRDFFKRKNKKYLINASIFARISAEDKPIWWLLPIEKNVMGQIDDAMWSSLVSSYTNKIMEILPVVREVSGPCNIRNKYLVEAAELDPRP